MSSYRLHFVCLLLSVFLLYTNGNSASPTCGRSTFPQPRIVHGTNATKGSWPWMAYFPNVSCGGSLIHPEWVLTAAHCVDNYDNATIKTFKVVLGEVDVKKEDGFESIHAVDQIIIHPNYNSIFPDSVADIAMVKLKTPAILNQFVNIPCLPLEDHRPNGTDVCYTTGWGWTHHPWHNRGRPAKMSRYLQQIELPIVNHKRCPYNSESICAGQKRTTYEAICDGDSGGPLVCYDDAANVWIQHGVTSYGFSDCRGYSMFVPVNKYINWIMYYINQI